MKRSLFRLVLALAMVAMAGTFAYAQSKASVSGVVVDSSGGVLPGVTVVVKNTATGASSQAVTNGSGLFSVPSLDAGTYQITITLQGFSTVVVNDVQLIVGANQDITKTVMQVGNMSTVVNVKSTAELINTQSSQVQTRISATEINEVPLVTRNLLNFVTLLPGVDTASTQRASTVNGLPQSTLNITIDGVNIQDNTLKTSDGFFALIRPQLDQVEEVTVTGAVPGANSAGSGAVQIAFVTRAGSNKVNGSAYYYLRHPNLNSNYYFNIVNGLPRNAVVVNQYGARLGGPIVIPGMIDGHGKAFFFINYEEMNQPTNATRTREVVNPAMINGTFTYNRGTTTAPVYQSVNLMNLITPSSTAALVTAGTITQTQANLILGANRFDPTNVSVLNQIDAATRTTGTLVQNSDPNTFDYIYQTSSVRFEHIPTTRLDFNLSPNHRLNGTYNFQKVNSQPDLLNGAESAFPGLPGAGNQYSYRNSGSLSLRSTLSANLVNQLDYGIQSSPVHFFTNITAADYTNQGGFAITLPGVWTNPFATRGPQYRNAPNWDIHDSLNWLKGKHSFSMGVTYDHFRIDNANYNTVPGINETGLETADPANNFFTAANFPGATTGQLSAAAGVYGMLTGRVNSISGTYRLDDNGNYVYDGPVVLRGTLSDIGSFVQDSWRMSPTVTLNAGLRWDVQLPFRPASSIMSTTTLADACGMSGILSASSNAQGLPCNLFQPGLLPSGTIVSPTYIQYTAGTKGYKTEWKNFAPNVGIAWRPNIKSGLLRGILGDPEQATIRGGFGVAYNRNGMNDFTGVYGSNPGSTTSGTRSTANGNLGDNNGVLLLSSLNPATVAPTVVGGQVVPATGMWPIAANTANSLNIFDPNIHVSHSTSYSLGLQRAFGRDMAAEVMYVGTRNYQGWTIENWNEVNFRENGFTTEFKNAMANLQANINSGVASRSKSFAYFGPGTGTVPLPTYLAYLTGSTATTDPTKYTASLFTNTTFVGRLNVFQPSVSGAAGDLASAARQSLGIAAGFAPNFWRMNPNVGNVNVTTGALDSQYDSVQATLRRRLSKGLSVSANFTYAFDRKVSDGSGNGNQGLTTLHDPRFLVRDVTGVPKALKLDWTYEIPVGRGRRFGTNMNSIVNYIIGGWSFDGTGRLQSGRQVSLTGVKLVGMTLDEFKSIYKVYKRNDPVTGVPSIYMLPQDVIDNTILAFSTSATSVTGYGSAGAPSGRYFAPESGAGCVAIFPGDCSGYAQVFATGPLFKRFDISFKKTFPFAKRANFQMEVDLLNAFDAINFIPVFTTSTTQSNYHVTSGYTDSSNTFDPGGRLGQLVWRINW
jgi:hypothetical protein